MVRISNKIENISKDLLMRFSKELQNGNIDNNDFKSVVSAIKKLKDVAKKTKE